MTELPPIDTPEERAALRHSNRRVLAERQCWPAGRLEECEQLGRDHPAWFAMWDVAGFRATRGRDDGWVPSGLRVAAGATLAELLIDMAVLEEYVQSERAREARPFRSITAER